MMNGLSLPPHEPPPPPPAPVLDSRGILRWLASIGAIAAFAALAWHKVLTGPEATTAVLAVLAGNLYPRQTPPQPPSSAP